MNAATRRQRLFWRLLAFSALLVLGGCVTTGQGSVAGGECKVFDAPKYAVRGARPYDQDWIDSTIEGGVGACQWSRPLVRPAEWDAPVPLPKARPVTKKPKKAGWIWRARSTVWPKKVVVPAQPAAVALPEIVAPEPEPPAAPPPVARSAIDELLHPSVN